MDNGFTPTESLKLSLWKGSGTGIRTLSYISNNQKATVVHKGHTRLRTQLLDKRRQNNTEIAKSGDRDRIWKQIKNKLNKDIWKNKNIYRDSGRILW